MARRVIGREGGGVLVAYASTDPELAVTARRDTSTVVGVKPLRLLSKWGWTLGREAVDPIVGELADPAGQLARHGVGIAE